MKDTRMHPLQIVESFFIMARATRHHLDTEKYAEMADLLSAEQILLEANNQIAGDETLHISLGLLQRLIARRNSYHI